MVHSTVNIEAHADSDNSYPSFFAFRFKGLCSGMNSELSEEPESWGAPDRGDFQRSDLRIIQITEFGYLM